MTDGSRLSVSRFMIVKVKSYLSFKSVKFGHLRFQFHVRAYYKQTVLSAAYTDTICL